MIKNCKINKNLEDIHNKVRISTTTNIVVADIEFEIKRNNTNNIPRLNKFVNALTVSFPIRISETDLYNSNNAQNFGEFYRRYKPIGGNGTIIPQLHCHSEAFLYCYLDSDQAISNIIKQLIEGKSVKPDSTQIQSINLCIHTTRSMCGSCQKLWNGFKRKFTNDLKQNLLAKQFQVNFRDEQTVHQKISFTTYSRYRQSIPHIQPYDLQAIQLLIKSPIDYFDIIENKFIFTKISHTLFTSGGQQKAWNEKFTNIRNGTIQKYVNDDAKQLEKKAIESANKIKAIWHNKSGLAKKEAVKLFEELPFDLNIQI